MGLERTVLSPDFSVGFTRKCKEVEMKQKRDKIRKSMVHCMLSLHASLERLVLSWCLSSSIGQNAIDTMQQGV